MKHAIFAWLFFGLAVVCTVRENETKAGIYLICSIVLFVAHDIVKAVRSSRQERE